MITFFGQDIGITEKQQCERSDVDHSELVRQARVSRIKEGFNVDESYVICTRCRSAISLKI